MTTTAAKQPVAAPVVQIAVRNRCWLTNQWEGSKKGHGMHTGFMRKEDVIYAKLSSAVKKCSVLDFSSVSLKQSRWRLEVTSMSERGMESQ